MVCQKIPLLTVADFYYIKYLYNPRKQEYNNIHPISLTIDDETHRSG